MSVSGTISLNIDLTPLTRALEDCGRHLHALTDHLRVAAYLSARAAEKARYEHGKATAALFPDHWEVFCVTTNEGRCRVISRPRGGWT